MKAISQFVVHVFDLIEAEGRVLLEVVRAEAKRAHLSAVHLLLGVGFLAVSVPLVVAGVLLVGLGIFWWMERLLGPAGGAAVTGLLVLVAGGVCMGAFLKLAKGTAEIMAEREGQRVTTNSPPSGGESGAGSGASGGGTGGGGIP